MAARQRKATRVAKTELDLPPTHPPEGTDEATISESKSAQKSVCHSEIENTTINHHVPSTPRGTTQPPDHLVQEETDEEEATNRELESAQEPVRHRAKRGKSENATKAKITTAATPTTRKKGIGGKKRKSIGDQRQTHPVPVLCCGCMLISALLCILFYPRLLTSTPFNFGDSGQVNRTELLEEFDRALQSLKEQFPNQLPRLWAIFRSTLRTHINQSDPIQPAVILLAGNPSAYHTVSCLASKLAAIYKHSPSASTHYFLDGTKLASERAEKVKEVIDLGLSRAFTDNSAEVAVIHGLDKLPPTSSLIFYKYCDNSMAPFTKVSILFTLQLPENRAANDHHKQWTKVVEAFLTTYWKTSPDMDIDKIGALLSRVGNSIVIVKDEPSLAQGCP